MESALGLLNLRDVCAKGTELSLRSSIFNVDGLVFGSDDYCADIGMFCIDLYEKLHDESILKQDSPFI